jgi:hypothetical protein
MRKRTIGLTIVAVVLLATALMAAPHAPQGVDMARTNAVRLFQVPAAGDDYLHFTVWDTIEIPGVGTDTVELNGTYSIRRLESNTHDWKTANLTIQLLGMDVRGASSVLGPVSVALNGANVGHVYPTDSERTPKFCVVEGQVKISLNKLGVTVFNKQPIPLAHQITHIPPIGQGGSSPDTMRIPLYNVADPNGAPVAYLLRVRTQIGGYVG